jgi:hypothetical protein
MMYLERKDPILEFCRRRAEPTKRIKSNNTVEIVETTTITTIEVDEVEIDLERLEEQEQAHDPTIDQEVLLKESWKKNIEDLKIMVTCLSDEPDREELHEILAKTHLLAGLLAHNE